MEIAIPRIASADLPVETLWLTGRQARGIRSDVRVAIWAATTAEAWVELGELVPEIAAESVGPVVSAELEE